MNLQQLYEIIEDQIIRCELRHQKPSDITIGIVIQTIKSVGTPTVDVKRVNMGFDFDHDKFIIYPEKDLSLTDHNALATMRQEAEEMGFTVREVLNLKRENKKLKQQLKEYENELR